MPGGGGYVKGVQAFAREKGYRLRGKHREIRLSHPGRGSREKLKTVVRQPVE
jgi:hypothetical protein